MKPVRFDYIRPLTLQEAVSHLKEAGFGGKILAGGQSLVPMMNFRLARPDVLVDLGGISELAGIAEDAQGFSIGAMARHAEVVRHQGLQSGLPVLPKAASMIGHWAIRNRGTVGGSLAHADPASEWAAVLTAVGASVDILGAEGTRTLPISELVVGPLTTVLAPDEILTRIYIPRPAPTVRYGIEEVARRPGDFALVGAVARVEGDDVDLTWFAMGGRPETRQIKGFTRLSPADQMARLQASIRTLAPESDIHASAQWRAKVATTVALRAVENAIAEGGPKNGRGH